MRYERQSANAAGIAAFLADHPRVQRVFYPGLAQHPGHALAARQQKSFGAMISFEVDAGGGRLADLLERLELFTLAESLGGVESLIAHPATMTHAAVAAEDQAAAGIGAGLLRLLVGIEHLDDLIGDLAGGLDAL